MLPFVVDNADSVWCESFVVLWSGCVGCCGDFTLSYSLLGGNVVDELLNRQCLRL